VKDIERRAGMSDAAWEITQALHPCIEGGTTEVKEGLLTNTRWLITTMLTVGTILGTGLVYGVSETSKATAWVTGVNSSLAILAGDHQELDDLRAAVIKLQTTANSTQSTSRDTNRKVGGPTPTNGPTQ
jgi:hypothetical protein